MRLKPLQEELGQGQEDHCSFNQGSPYTKIDYLTNLFEGKNINRKMTLRNQLKNVKIQNSETIQSYFMRVAQIKEQLEAVDEEVENAQILMATLNGLPT